MIYLMWIGILIISGVIFLMAKKRNNKEFKPNKKAVKFFNNVYKILIKIPGVKHKLHSIEIKLYNNTLDEDWKIRYKSTVYYILSWFIWILSIAVVVFIFNDNIYVMITLLVFSFEVKNLFLDFLIGDDTNFLVGIYNYSTELQKAFTLTKSIEAAIDEANINSTNYNIVKRMEYVSKVMDDSEKIQNYISECPNDYLKLLLINCNLVNENGDKKDAEGKSIFNENISYNNNNIEAEVFKRRQLKFWLRGMTLLCIVPLLAFKPYDTWVLNKLPITSIFYQTSKGFICKILITIICIALFYVIKAYKNVDKKVIKVKQSYWEKYFFKVLPLKKLVLFITPKEKSVRGYKYRQLVSESGEYTRTEYIYLRKILFSVFSFVITLCMFFSIHSINRQSIMNDTGNKQIIIVNNNQEYTSKIENSLLNYVNLKNAEVTYKNLSEQLGKLGIKDNNNLIKRIVEKKEKIENEHIHWYDILISFLIGCICSFIPEAMLKAKGKFRKVQMENEIIIFETVILIYMYHDTSTIEIILETMLKFSDIFKNQIQEVLKEVKKSDQKALKDYINSIKYKPLLNLLRNLIKAEDIKVREAFINMADNRRSFLMNRKEENRRVVYKRVSNARLLSLIPINLIIVGYIAVPMLYVAFNQLDNSQVQLNLLESGNQNNLEYNIDK